MAYDILREDVPHFRRRPGDMVISGPNNATIVLGRDRVDVRESGYGDRESAGAILAVVGRGGPDPSVRDDRATLYISAMSDPDEMTGDTRGGSERGVSSAIVRADSIRISARRDVKVAVGSAWLLLKEDGTVIVDGDIQLGEGASQRLLRESYHSSVIVPHVHPGGTLPNGSTGPAVYTLPPTVLTDKTRG